MKEIMRNPDSFGKILELTVSALSLEEIMVRVVEELRDLFNCDRCTLYVIDKKANELYTQVTQNNRIGNFRIPLDKNSIAGFVAITGRDVLIADVYDDKALKKIDKELSFFSSIDVNDASRTKQMMATPLKIRGATIGALQAMNKPGGFLTRDMDAMREFSPILALALNHALLMQEQETCEA